MDTICCRRYVCSSTYFSKTNKTCGNEDCLEFAKSRSRYSKGSFYFNKNENKNVFFHSSWENVIAEYLDDRNIKWIRPKPIEYIIDKVYHYFPDFYLPDFDVYLDPKNKVVMMRDKPKLDAVISQNNIILKYGDCPTIIEWLGTLPG